MQFFLSTTSLFHAHVLPRSLSNSPETLLTTLALVYFPFRAASSPKTIVVGNDNLVASHSMKDVTTAKPGITRESRSPAEGEKDAVLRVDDAAEINYAVMDRLGPDITEHVM